jgi:hypothetical protein
VADSFLPQCYSTDHPSLREAGECKREAVEGRLCDGEIIGVIRVVAGTVSASAVVSRETTRSQLAVKSVSLRRHCR